MRKIGERSARIISEFAWIEAGYKDSDSGFLYSLIVHNGKGLRGDFRITSCLKSPNYSFLPDREDGQNSLWQAELTDVWFRSERKDRQVGRDPQCSDKLKVEITEVGVKYGFDKVWRLETPNLLLEL